MSKYLNISTCILLVFIASGCESDPKNMSTICTVNYGNETIKVVNYDLDVYHWNPHVAGHFKLMGVVYKEDKRNRHKQWLLMKISSDKKYISREICEKSSISEDVVIVYPVPLTIYINKSIKWGNSSKQSEGLNNFLIMRKVDNEFHIYNTPNDGGPYLVDVNNTRLNNVNWVNRKIIYKDGKIIVTQVDYLKSSFTTFYEKGDFTIPFRYLEGRGYGCPECYPVIMREMILPNTGEDWVLSKYRVLNKEKMKKDVHINQ